MRFRDCIAAALITLWAASAASAQQTVDESSQIRHGERKIRIGLALIAAGALVIPATYIVSDRLTARGESPGRAAAVRGDDGKWGQTPFSRGVQPRRKWGLTPFPCNGTFATDC